ncbi:MAG TPA: PDZ domain-containing protein [Vicinamibacterales bacterium]|mgnify:FL=1|nr:PDZ domain-containing protein [Vicinamibacterales bacterium]HPW21713.1 PDZ domain-containing protein [Vicinamibacterales bacterium]
MLRSIRFALPVVLTLLVAPITVSTQPGARDTRLLAQPATSGTHVAFVYADDLWTARLDGSDVRRLTTDLGAEGSPAFSPDGKLLAFSAQYDGNVDVYVLPVEGGVPRRLTWHPGADLVQGFTPDGASVLFTSGRAAFTGAHQHLFTVPVAGGIETQLPIPNANQAAYSPDGTRIAYVPLPPAFQQWKQYRGGRVSRLWLYSVADHAIEKVPQPPERSNDVDPMWIGGTVYFRSDRDGEFNVYGYDTASKQVRRLTSHGDFPVMKASAGGGKIVYEQAGWLHLLDPATGASRRLAIGVVADLRETRPRFVKGPDYIRNADISPSGARAVFEYRGEIVTVPAEKGDARNLTNSPGAHERAPAWSPDGTRIAYFSDASGEYELHVAPQDGKGEVKRFRPGGAGFYSAIRWSPDSRRLAFQDNSQSLFWIDLATGAVKRVGGNRIVSPAQPVSADWSPDSKWLAYVVDTQPLVNTVFVYSTEQDKSFAVTDGLSEVTEPVFDKGGKYLYLFGSTDAGPVQDWFALSNQDMRRTRSLYVAVLRKGLPSPLAKESDEEKPKKADGAGGKPEAAKPGDTTAAEPAADAKAGGDAKEPFSIDLDGLQTRIVALPIPAGDLSSLKVGDAGHVYYLVRAGGESSLHHFNLATRKDETPLSSVDSFALSADAKKILYAKGRAWFITALAPKIAPGEGRIAAGDIEVRIDPRAEWTQIFNEAWRINRDYFYAANMHGVDWRAMREKYAAFLPDLATRDDLNRVIQWMCSELAVGHHRVGGGDRLDQPKSVPGGLLGADYEIANGRYRFKKVLGGLNWTPDLRAPLTEPGVDVKAGEYLLAVNGRDVRPPANLYSFFENTSGRITELTVGPNPDGSGSRTVQAVPVASETALRNRDWVEGNLAKVDRATGGRVAYVYVPNTSAAGHASFKRYFFPQSHKDAVIVDERFNGGGLVADYYIDILRRPFISNWHMRYGDDLKTPTASIQGPKVMIIDEMAGSGGDLLPWMFRKFKLGPLVGQRTWGGLVGTLGFPILMDGGRVTAPNLAIWTPEDGWVVENEGVPPDIDVEQTPADVIAGRDPQLEKAIEVAMAELKKAPPTPQQRPPYPVRGRTQRGTFKK